MGGRPPLPVRIARPIISVDGHDNDVLSSGLLHLLIVETVNGVYECAATFNNWGPVGNSTQYLYFDRPTLDFGKQLQVRLAAAQFFSGRIRAIGSQFADVAPQLTVTAEDRFGDLRMTRRTRTFVNVTDSELFRLVASEHGLTADVSVVGPTHEVVAQLNQSDLEFIRGRARGIDVELWMDGATLHARTHVERSAGTLEMSLGSALRSFTVTADLASQRTKVGVSGWDVTTKAPIARTATESAISSELNGGVSGASILASAFGDRQESLARTVPLNTREAQAYAEALFRMSARKFITGRGVAEPNESLRVGGHVNLLGLGPLFSGTYYVTEARHSFDASIGMRTEFVVERPGLGRP